MNRGGSRRTTFVDDDDRTSFGQRLADMHEHFGIVVLAYCLMTNHFHLLLHCPDAGLSEGMQRLSSMFTRHVNARHGADGALFRGRFLSRLITSERHLANAVRYIHRNPLDISGVEDVADYRWSSHRTYLGCRRCPTWLDTAPILGRFGGDVREFDAFVRSPGFPPDRPDVEVIRDAARLVSIESTDTAETELVATVRTATLSAIDRLGGYDPQLVAAALEIPSPGAHRTAVSRARAAVQRSAEVRRLVDRTIELVA
jgi:putative transposase